MLPVLLLIALVALPLLGLYTGAGVRALLPLAARLGGIEAQYGGGSLAGTLRLENLRMQREGLSFSAGEVTLRAELGCLWRGAICLRELGIGSLALSIEGGAAQEPAAPVAAPAAPFEFPVPVTVRALHIDSARIEWPGGQWSQGAARLALDIQGRKIGVTKATVAAATLTLSDTPQGEPAAPGAPPPIDLPLLLQVENLTLEAPTIVLSGQTYALRRLLLAAAWERNHLRVDQLSLDSAELGQLTLRDGALQLQGAWPLKADIELTTPDGLPWPVLAGRSARLSMEGDLAALALDIDIPGEPALSGGGNINLLATQPVFAGQFVVDATAPIALADYAELPESVADIEVLPPVEVTVGGSVAQQEFSVVGAVQAATVGVVTIDGSALLKGERLDIEALRLNRQDGAGELLVEGELDWREGIAWNLAARSPGLILPTEDAALAGHLEGSLSSSGSLQDGGRRIAFNNIAISGEVGGSPARIEGTIALDGNELTPDSALRARLPGAELSVRPAADAPGATAVSLHVRELGQWLPELTGEVKLDGRIDGAGRYSLRGDIGQLHWNDLQAGSGSLSARYDSANEGVDLSLTLDKVQTPLGRSDSLALAVLGDGDELHANFTGTGALAGELDLVAQRQKERWTAELAPTTLDIAGQTWRLETPVTFTQSADETLEITAHCWLQAHASLCTQNWTLPPREDNSATLTADAQLFERWLPENTALSGQLQARLSAVWGPDRETSLHLAGEAGPILVTLSLAEGEQRQSRWQHLAVDARYSAGKLDLEASLASADRAELALALQLPAQKEQPLSGSLRIDDLDLTALTGLSSSLGGLSGSIDGNLQLGGSVARPLLNGELQLQGGKLSLAGNPTELEKLDLRLLARGDRATLTGSGLLGGGDLALEGELLTTPQPRLTLSLRGRDNTLLYPPSAHLLTSSDLTLSALAGELSLNGDLTVHGGVFEYEQLPDSGVALSDDVVLVDGAGRAVEEEQPIAVSMNVRVLVEDDFLLRGPQLEASLSGDLQLRRRPRQPLEIFGSLNTAGGYANVFERTLQIKRGVISFSGAPDNPLLDLRAERSISGSDVTAGAHVHGALATDLSLDIYSDPPMPRSEAMSWLIWGRGLSSGTGGDGAVLALSLAGSVVNRSSLVSTINEVPGIDNVSFGAEGSEEDAAATVSGYVGERLYLSYGIGLYEPINVLTARLFLQTRLWLEVVSRLENSVDLYYSFDID
ncbi:MAG: translocation/assembly module TamB domain-containing protein [Halioglobus sp.]